MKTIVKQGSIIKAACDVLVVNLFEGAKSPGGGTGVVDSALDDQISIYVIGKEGFKGKFGEMYVLPTFGKIPADKVLIVGLGKSEEFSLNKIRELSSKVIKKVKSLKAKNVCTILHGAGNAQMPAVDCAQMIIEGTIIGDYEFNKYKTQKNGDENNKKIEVFEIVEIDQNRIPDINTGIEKGRIIAESVNLARNLVNEPSCELTPSKLAETALSIKGFNCKIYEKEDIEKMKMGAYLAVAKGSSEPLKFIHMTYKPMGHVKKKIAIVGKGITFDSGGLDLKPPASMRTMKEDMSGSAATLGIMNAISKLEPDVEVHGIIAACENMPGSCAYKPGDVLKAMNGKTIEVDNTDAEGRLTLADALSYAANQDVDEIIDVATLTGACAVALGSYASGIMGNNQELIDLLITSASQGGERFWQLPLLDEHKDDLKSSIADKKNVGSRYEGASTAGALLKEFVGNKKWAHIDIAGTAYIDKPLKELSKGATGTGVRALINYILSY